MTTVTYALVVLPLEHACRCHILVAQCVAIFVERLLWTPLVELVFPGLFSSHQSS